MKRGKFLLDNFLGTPPPPAPPNIPALRDVTESGTPMSVRQQMESHRSNPGCASCHQIMDPLGFALENFDAIGKWRTTDGGAPIDASGMLADGSRVDGVAALRGVLVSHSDQFAQTVTEKLLTYALGRGVEFYDATAVRQIYGMLRLRITAGRRSSLESCAVCHSGCARRTGRSRGRLPPAIRRMTTGRTSQAEPRVHYQEKAATQNLS